MAERIKVSSMADLEKLAAEKETIKSYVDEIISKIKGVSKLEVKLSSAGSSKEILDLVAQMEKGQRDLIASTKAYDQTVKESAKTQKEAAQVAKEKALAEKAEAQALKELAAAIKEEAAAEKEGNLSKKAAAQAEKESAAAKLNEAKAAKESATATLQEARSSTENAKARAIEARMAAQITNEKQKLERATQNELKNQAKLSSAYDQLRFKYNLAATSAKNFGAQMGTNSPEFLEAAGAAQKYYQELIKIETAVGQSQRKVGQYENATFALSQTLRELPSFAYSVQTGILGISNNLPILGDQFKALATQTGSSVQAFKIMAFSIFSVSNLVTIAIGLFTIFAGKIFASGREAETSAIKLKVYSDTVEKAKASIEDLNKEIDYNNKLGKVNVDIDNTNIPKLDGLKRELLDLGATSIQNSTLISELDDKIKTLYDNASAARSNFLKNASEKAKGAYLDGSIDAIADKLEEADKKLYESTKGADKGLEELQAKRAAAEQEQTLIYRDIAKQKGEIQKLTGEESRKLILESVRVETGMTQKKNEDILNNDRSTLESRLLALKGNLEARKRMIEAEKNDVLNDPTTSAPDRLLAPKKAAADARAAELEIQAAVFKTKEEFRLRDLAANVKNLTEEKRLIADYNQEVANNTELTLKQRIEAQNESYKAEKTIIDAAYKLQLQQAGLSELDIALFTKDNDYKVKSKKITDQELIGLAKDYETQILDLTVTTNGKVTDILKTELDRQARIRGENLDYIRRLYANLDLTDTTVYSKDVIALNKSLLAGKISYEKYLKERAKLDKEYEERAKKAEVMYLQDQLKQYTDAASEEIAARKRVEDLKRQFAEATDPAIKKELAQQISAAQSDYDRAKANVDKKIDLEDKLAKATIAASDKSTEKIKKNDAEILAAKTKLRDEVFNLVTAIGEGSYDRQKNQVQDLIDTLERKTELEIKGIEASALTEQQKADKIKTIEAKAAAEKTTLEQRQRKIDQERARFEREMAIFRIISSTAIGYTNAMSGPPPAPPNPVLAQLIAASGAVQLAALLATPIPKYAKGTKNHPGGAAIVGDGGVSEVVQEPGGRVYITPDRPTLVNSMPRGSKVYPSIEKAAPSLVSQTLAPGFARPSTTAAREDKLTGALLQEMRRTREAIKNKREHYWTIKNGEVSLSTRDGYNQTTYLNKSLHF